MKFTLWFHFRFQNFRVSDQFFIYFILFTDEESANKVHTSPGVCFDVKALAKIVPKSFETANRTS